MLNTDSSEVVQFLKRWHESGRADFERQNTKLVYDEYAQKIATTRRKYIAADFVERGQRSGQFLIDRATGDVFSIRGYGVPHQLIGHITDLFW